jgi:hypothetical protein
MALCSGASGRVLQGADQGWPGRAEKGGLGCEERPLQVAGLRWDCVRRRMDRERDVRPVWDPGVLKPRGLRMLWRDWGQDVRSSRLEPCDAANSQGLLKNVGVLWLDD